MPSQLDLDLERAFERHYAPGGLLETKPVRVERFGVEMPMLVQAPPALPQYLAYFSMQNAEKEFLVDGDVRLTFAQAYAAAREAVACDQPAHCLARSTTYRRYHMVSRFVIDILRGVQTQPVEAIFFDPVRGI